jgi:hypothetical protein
MSQSSQPSLHYSLSTGNVVTQLESVDPASSAHEVFIVQGCGNFSALAMKRGPLTGGQEKLAVHFLLTVQINGVGTGHQM